MERHVDTFVDLGLGTFTDETGRVITPRVRVTTRPIVIGVDGYRGYQRARWRCVSPARGGEIGVAFNLDDGRVIRMLIPLEDARRIEEEMGRYRRLYEAAVAQSPMSSGRSSSDGSPTAGQSV